MSSSCADTSGMVIQEQTTINTSSGGRDLSSVTFSSLKQSTVGLGPGGEPGRLVPGLAGDQ